MPQALLPIIPAGATPINDVISVVRESAQWTYFCGVQPIFRHAQDDQRSFRMFTAQLCRQGSCTQAQIVRSLGVSKKSVLRSVAKYRQQGIKGFYQPRRSPRGLGHDRSGRGPSSTVSGPGPYPPRGGRRTG